MTIQTINLGNYANDGTGDDLRVAFTKVNENFAALDASAAIANGVNVGTGVGIFFAKDTTNLQFKSLTSTNSSVTISSTGNTVNLEAVTRLQSDLTPALGANLNLNNHYVYGGDIQSTVYGYNVPVSAMVNSLLIESNSLAVDMGSFLTPTGYETDGLAGKKGYLLDWGLFSDTPINDKLNFGSFSDHLTGGIGQLTLAGNLTTVGAYNLTLTTTGNTSLTLPTSGTLTTTANNLSAFAATTSAQLLSVISDETGTGKLVFATSPTLVTPALGTPSSGDFSSGTFTWPTFNQNTSGTAVGLSGTQTQNYVYAAPTGANGTASFRTLTAADIPSSLNATTINNNLTVTGNYIHSINATVAAAGNAVQATATPLTKDVNILTTVTAGSATGVALPAGTAGMIIFVYNTTATAANVYPVNGGTASINALGNNAAFSLAATTGARFVCASATKWYTI